jgi:chromosome transmission fidelity protein 1
VECGKRQLADYLARYQSRLRGKNIYYIKQILFILNGFTKLLKRHSSSPGGSEPSAVAGAEAAVPLSAMYSINKFLCECKIDNVNLFEVQEYMEVSRIAQKMGKFVDWSSAVASAAAAATTAAAVANNTASSFSLSSKVPVDVVVLTQLQTLLAALTNANDDGRVLVVDVDPPKHEVPLVAADPSRVKEKALRFLMLNPYVHFQELVKEAHSVILTGGTMKPVSEVVDNLFGGGAQRSGSGRNVELFSCGHIIPKHHIKGLCVTSGPSGMQFNFTHKHREADGMMDELGRLLVNVCNVVPEGVVCFLPSYGYEKTLLARWKKTGIIDKIGKKKKVFHEPASSREVDGVLTAYGLACNPPEGSATTRVEKGLTGGFLFSVVGGKMSEGINFSDGLARCVVMVGLPYPNPTDPVLVEKMAYINKKAESGTSSMTGQDFYRNICMKAVNQTIGRAIRHKGDYSTVLLVDHRYEGAHVQKHLPEWISESLETPGKFGHAVAKLRQFYRAFEPPNIT